MAHNLPGLPIESLINIVRQSNLWDIYPRWICLNMRLTCKELDAKLLRFYGTECCRQVKVVLSESGLQGLLSLSQSSVALHIQSLAIDCDLLLEQQQPRATSSESSGCDDVSSDSQMDEDEWNSNRTTNQSIIDLVKYGTCATLLVPALGNLSNLQELHLLQPGMLSGMKQEKRDMLRDGWAVMVRSLLSITMPRISPLQVLDMRSFGGELSVDMITLEDMAIHMCQLSHLKKLHLNLAVVSNDPKSSDHAHMMTLLVQKASLLKDVHLGFGCSVESYNFFKKLSGCLRFGGLRRLALAQLQTRKKYLKMLLRTCKDTLESLTLEWVSFTESLLSLEHFLLDEMNLRELTLCHLNFDGKGIYFNRISKQRPTCHDNYDEDWTLVIADVFPTVKIVLDKDEGDDLEYWLGCIEADYEVGDEWKLYKKMY